MSLIKKSALCAIAAIAFQAAPAMATGEAEVSTPVTGMATLPADFKNADNLRYQIKAFKSHLVSVSSNYAENDARAKKFFKNLIGAIADCNVTPLESAGISDELANLMYRIKVVDGEQNRVFVAFAKVMDEAYIPKNVINRMISNAQEVMRILENKKREQADPDGLIYKYFGVEGKGRGVFDRNDPKQRGFDKFFTDRSGDNAPDMVERMANMESARPEKKKKIVGIEFMDPTVKVEETMNKQAAKDAAAKADPAAKEKSDIDELFDSKKPDAGGAKDEKKEEKKEEKKDGDKK